MSECATRRWRRLHYRCWIILRIYVHASGYRLSLSELHVYYIHTHMHLYAFSVSSQQLAACSLQLVNLCFTCVSSHFCLSTHTALTSVWILFPKQRSRRVFEKKISFFKCFCSELLFSRMSYDCEEKKSKKWNFKNRTNFQSQVRLCP